MPGSDESEIPKQPWSDVCLRGLSWTNEGRDLALAVRFPGSGPSSRRDMTLHCRWASNLHVALTFKENQGGFPLTWDVIFDRADCGWKIELDFAGAGRIVLSCSEMELK
ncbi:MAG: hypothetical protein DRJ42_27865 [Deltaproteobacteria bacterium]|nr:MAG: hypothetical protein DRJ42_27865 [Deltaproteobacteria bacterium]